MVYSSRRRKLAILCLLIIQYYCLKRLRESQEEDEESDGEIVESEEEIEESEEEIEESEEEIEESEGEIEESEGEIEESDEEIEDIPLNEVRHECIENLSSISLLKNFQGLKSSVIIDQDLTCSNKRRKIPFEEHSVMSKDTLPTSSKNLQSPISDDDFSLTCPNTKRRKLSCDQSAQGSDPFKFKSDTSKISKASESSGSDESDSICSPEKMRTNLPETSTIKDVPACVVNNQPSCSKFLISSGSSDSDDEEKADMTHETSMDNHTLMQERLKRFESLQKRTHDVRMTSQRHAEWDEKRKARKLVRKIMQNPELKELDPTKHDLNALLQEENDKVEWNSVKPFMDVNSHIQGSVSHGDCGPKTELETCIDDAIKDGDFGKAELLSDNLANRKFAEKICKAYEAKRCQEKLEAQKTEEKDKDAKKIKWMFTAKERWQMKGNM